MVKVMEGEHRNHPKKVLGAVLSGGQLEGGDGVMVWGTQGWG